jgi:hypothetical protein
LHIRRYIFLGLVARWFASQSTIPSGSSARCLIGAVGRRQKDGIHGHDWGNPTMKKSLPFLFTDLFTVIAACNAFCFPFLLEKSVSKGILTAELFELKEIVWGPILSDEL